MMNQASESGVAPLPTGAVKAMLTALSMVFMAGCAGKKNSPELERTTECTCLVRNEPSKDSLKSQNFEKSGFTEQEKKQLESEYGSYFGTFEGMPIFEVKVEHEKSGDAIGGTIVTKVPAKRIRMEVDVPGKLNWYRYRYSERSKDHPFTSMHFKLGFVQDAELEPTIRVISAERD